jgi:hypothetical protein
MTPYEAKALSLEVWRYLAEHPEIGKKELLPDEFYEKIENLTCECPLCDLYRSEKIEPICPKCPLGRCDEGSFFLMWLYGFGEARQAAAQKIVAAIEAWEPEEVSE